MTRCLFRTMIDTLRVRIRISYQLWMELDKQRAYGTLSPGLVRIRSYLKIPPYDGIVTISTEDFKYVFLEASLPKIAFGHNVKLLYPSEIPPILEKIEKAFIEQYGEIPSWEKWEVQRIDICYAWSFKKLTKVINVLRFLRTQEYPDKDIHWYPDETITFGGRSFSISFYSKQPEFRRQYKKLKRNGFPKEAEEGLALSKGVLRFEVRLFGQKLTTLLHEEILYCKDILNINFYYNVLNACLTKLLRNPNRSSLSDLEAVKKFKSVHRRDQVLRMFCFWKTYYAVLLHAKSLLKSIADSTTISRNLKDISVAGVGIPDSSCHLPFDLSIPSIHVVNPEPVPTASAVGKVEGIMGVQEMFDLLFKDEEGGKSV
jgi:II/X family phage/plasmid replication protein